MAFDNRLTLTPLHVLREYHKIVMWFKKNIPSILKLFNVNVAVNWLLQCQNPEVEDAIFFSQSHSFAYYNLIHIYIFCNGRNAFQMHWPEPGKQYLCECKLEIGSFVYISIIYRCKSVLF